MTEKQIEQIAKGIAARFHDIGAVLADSPRGPGISISDLVRAVFDERKRIK